MLRRVLFVALASVVAICLGCIGAGVWLWAGSKTDTVGKVAFTTKLAVPPLAPSRLDGQGRRVFDLNLRSGQREFFPGKQTRTWGVNGDYLGPTVRAKRGEQVVMNVRNSLDEQTTLHWHGMHLPPSMDGGPHQMVEPGATWSPTWKLDQPAASLWYHPHLHGRTAAHVYRGLAGMFLIDDDATPRDLPHDYGTDDIPLVVQDKEFERSGQLDDSASGGLGILGDTLLVNGTKGPYLDVTTERVRLRILNGSNARIYNFGFSDNREFALVGTDGGLLAAPHTTNRVRLSAGERAEIVVTVKPGERTVLRSYAPDLGVNSFERRSNGGDDRFDVLELRAAASPKSSPAVPAKLVDIPRINAKDATATRTFKLSGHNINNKQMDMGRIDLNPTLGTAEIWEVNNSDGQPHNFHVHDVQFQVLSVDGKHPPAELGGWKDTIFLPPGKVFRLIMRFTDYADPNVPYMYHCHVLFHEDAGMMGQFVVTAPGQQPGKVASTSKEHRKQGARGTSTGHDGHGGK